MKQNILLKRMAALVLCLAMLMTCVTVVSAEDLPTDVPNGDFEELSANGRWVGWKRKDAAFNVRGTVADEKLNGAPMEKSGEYYFSGIKGGNPVMRGTLTSEPFVLGGTGFIYFKIGAGKNTEKCYVEFFEQGNDEPLARVANEDCDGVYIGDHLITRVVDLSAYIGKPLYIVATDTDEGDDYSYLNLDAFHTLQSQEEIDAAYAEHDAQIAAYGPKPFVEDPTATTIVNGGFETGDLTGWLLLDGKALTVAGVVPTAQRYWNDRAVYGEGKYYLDGSNNGAILESATGAIRSQKFTLAGDGYISLMMGAGNRNCYVALCDAETDEELIVQENTGFADPSLALTLLRYYMDASAYLGKVVYIKVVDANDTSAFAFLNVDDFRVSMTADEVAALEVEQLEKIQNETYNSASYDDLTTLRNYYSNYPYPVPLQSLTFTAYAANQVVDCGTVDLTAFLADAKAVYGASDVTDIAVTKVVYNGVEATEGFDAFPMNEAGFAQVTYTAAYEGKTAEAAFTVVVMADRHSVANGGFEAGNLAGWAVVDGPWAIVEGQAAGVISAQTYWGENLPYNQSGDYHLDGWNTGIDEPVGWTVQSTNFVLGGSGFISVKMGGNAAGVKVFLADGTQIGHYRQTRFADHDFPSLKAGGSWADMGTYVMDLSAYVGQEMYIQLCDEVIDGGWAHAFFDEVVTVYETAPDVDSLSDEVGDGGSGQPVQIRWQLAKNLI